MAGPPQLATLNFLKQQTSLVTSNTTNSLANVPLITANTPKVATITGATTLTAAQTGTLFLVDESTSPYTITLPALSASQALIYTFVVQTVSTGDVTIARSGTDNFPYSSVELAGTPTDISGGSTFEILLDASNSTVGDFVEIMSVSGPDWFFRGSAVNSNGISSNP